MPSRGRLVALGAVAAALVGVVGAFGASTGAQSATDPIGFDVVSLDASGVRQAVPAARAAAVSDRANVIAYEAVEPAVGTRSETSRVWLRDRVDETSRPVAEFASVAPGLSGDGCVVAYSVLDAVDVNAALTVVDRCAADSDLPLPIGDVLDTASSVGVGAPAVSFDGSTIAWSTGSEIRRYQRPVAGEPFVRTHSVDLSVTPTPDIVTGRTVDVSADGTLIVYVAGPGAEPFVPTAPSVYLWDSATPAVEPQLLSSTPTGTPGATGSTSPTISADGSFIVFESASVDLAAVGASTVLAPFVVGVDRVAATAQVLIDDATQPAVSADGLHVVYQRGDAVRVLSSVDGTAVDVDADELAVARPLGPVAISQYGRWLVFASSEDLQANPDPADVTVGDAAMWAADLLSSSSEVVDTTTTTTTTTTTVSPTGPTTTAAGPTTTATPTTSPTTTVETSPATTEVVNSAAGPTVTVPASPIDRFPTTPQSFPRVVIPRPAPRPTPSRSFVSTPPAPAPSASPVTFEPTVVTAGRRVQPVTLFNSTPSTIGVTSVSVDAVGGFAIVSDSCAGVRLAPAASCAVDVQFAPLELGPANSLATFLLSDGSTVTASLAGEGVPEPTLDLLPAVAGAGQTVTVFGAGFPAGSTVELTQPGVAQPQVVVVDGAGTFAHVVVVLPNSPTGPMLLAVAGQTDVFADVDAELLVSSRGATSGGAALRSGLGNSSQR